MAMCMALRGSSTRPLPSVQTCARPVLSWAVRWKGSAAPAEKKPIEKVTAAKPAEEATVAADKVIPEVNITSKLPVTFEVKRKDVRFENYQSIPLLLSLSTPSSLKSADFQEIVLV